jgi:hypothetical protein
MHKISLASKFARDRAHALIDRAPPNYVVTIAEPKRTNAQNDKMWAMLTDVSVSKPEGRRMIPDDWKVIFMSACGWECQFLEGLDGRPFPRGFSTSQLTKSQMGDLINFIQEYGDRHGVRWTDNDEQELAA